MVIHDVGEYATQVLLNNPSVAIGLYRVAKRLQDGSAESNAIMHKLRKKTFGIWTPFQMEDFLYHPVVHDAARKAEDFKTIMGDLNDKIHSIRKRRQDTCFDSRYFI